MSRILNAFLVISIGTASLAAQQTQGAGQGAGVSAARAATPQTTPAARKAAIDVAIADVDAALNQSRPVNIAGKDITEWDGESKWLSSVRSQLGTLSTSYAKSIKGGTPPVATINTQFLKTVESLTQEGSRRFQTLSNASKARHDIAMNAIRNLK